MDDRRNPYVILGIPYGASRGDARRAAARRSRELRTRQNAKFSTEDVTWALHQVEQVIDDASSAVAVFRVPAASGILDAPAGRGLFHPPPVPLPRRSEPLSDEAVAQIRSEATIAVSMQVITALASHVACWPPEHDEGGS